MHFGNALYTVTTGDVLTAICPIDYRFCLIVLIMSVLTGWLLTVTYHKSLTPWMWILAGDLVVIGLVSSNATVIINPKEGKVHITRVLFFYPTRDVYDFAALTGAAVHDSDQADALRLVFSNGTDLQLTPYNQMGGKNVTAAAINTFVQEHAGSGAGY